MRSDTVERLLRLNLEFYQTFAGPFAETRLRLQPGVLRALERTPDSAPVLDLGCGGGSLAQALARRGHSGPYLGLDWSPALLERALRRDLPARYQFRAADLGSMDWAQMAGGPWERVFAFAVVHHLPGADSRARFLRHVRGVCGPQGRLILSVWNFQASPRLRRRVVDWSAAGIHPSDVEPGDFLLDWRRGGRGLRYVHHFAEPELAELAQAAGFRVEDTYRSDGEGGRLGLYQVWAPID